MIQPTRKPPSAPPPPPAAAPALVVARRIGQQLVADGRVRAPAIDDALRRHAKDEVRPAWALVAAGVIGEPEWLERVGNHFGLAVVRIADFTIDRGLVARVPEELARRQHVLPLCNAGGEIYVACTDPSALPVFDHLKKLLGTAVLPVLVAPSELAATLEKVYLREQAVDFEHVEDPALTDLSPAEVARLKEEGESGKVVQLVDRLLAHALSIGASDIHVEPAGAHLRVRFRVDGAMREGPRYPIALSPTVASRIKVMAQLDISERYVPQDGRVRLRRGGHDLDLRVSVVPVARGEKVVIRLLSAGREHASLADLGLPAPLTARLSAEVARPHGMFLVTGPTGSGKTSTLYGLLRARAAAEVNIVTVEDPVEYELETLNQIPINPKRGVTFAVALRAILRQDPDLILVGEIRDLETASIAAEAALTGHLLLSTMHTNDAAGAVLRLCEMGVPRFLVGAVMNAVVAQRLVRRVCPACAQPYRPSVDELVALGPELEALTSVDDLRLMRPIGCPSCDGVGYRGRVPIIELLTVDAGLRAAIIGGADAPTLHAHAVANGMADLRAAALERLFARDTTVAEVVRVCQGLTP